MVDAQSVRLFAVTTVMATTATPRCLGLFLLFIFFVYILFFLSQPTARGRLTGTGHGKGRGAADK